MWRNLSSRFLPVASPADGPVVSPAVGYVSGIKIVPRGIVIALAVSLSGCSADIKRFNAPVLGFGKTSAASPPSPLSGDRSLFAQRPPSSPGLMPSEHAGPIQSGPVRTGSVTKSKLPPAIGERRYPKTLNNRAKTYAPASAPPVRTALLSPRRSYRNGSKSYPAPIDRARQTIISPDKITVQAGDTLYELSRRYGVSVSDIKTANGLRSNVIQPGQQLQLRAGPKRSIRQPIRRQSRATGKHVTPRDNRLPLGSTYTVRSGDSIYAIARRNGLKSETLLRINGIRDARRLRPGMVLKLRENSVGPSYRQAERDLPREQVTKERPSRPGAFAKKPRFESGGAQPRIINSRRVTSMPIPLSSSPASINSRLPGTKVASASPGLQRTIGTGKFRWPIRGRIVRGFGKRADGTNNDGIDIAVPPGTEVHSAESGVIAYAGDELKGYGNLILVRHEGGWVTAYAHNKQLFVRRGDTVQRGQVIAKTGKTGNIRRPMLHFELRKGARPVDPLPHLERP